jgi:hypothetical protein
MIWKIWKKGKLNSEQIRKIWKSKLKSEKIWEIQKKGKLNNEKDMKNTEEKLVE